MTVDEVLRMARALQLERYAEASAVFAAGSLVREEGTADSDVDLVVIFPRLERAYRESFRFEAYPVEAFVHDPETMAYFFHEVDRRSGIPALPQMVAEGIEVPAANELTRMLKQQAAAVIEMGPAALTPDTEQRLRYGLTDLVSDLRDPRSRDEVMGIGSKLFEDLANYYFRANGLWSAKGKAIVRTLDRASPDLAVRYGDSFERLFTAGDVGPVLRLAEDILRPHGGWLFEGYRADAPETWRTP